MRKFAWAWVLWITFAATTALSAPISVGTIEGSVVDAHGQPVAGASVVMQTSDGQHPHATHTSATGHFQFTHFATGQYDLRAYFKGAYSDWVKRVPLRSKKQTEITLRLNRR
jgi:hypothetical protein